MGESAQVLTCLQKWREKGQANANPLDAASVGQLLASIIAARLELAIESDESQKGIVKSTEKSASPEKMYLSSGIEVSL